MAYAIAQDLAAARRTIITDVGFDSDPALYARWIDVHTTGARAVRGSADHRAYDAYGRFKLPRYGWSPNWDGILRFNLAGLPPFLAKYGRFLGARWEPARPPGLPAEAAFASDQELARISARPAIPPRPQVLPTVTTADQITGAKTVGRWVGSAPTSPANTPKVALDQVLEVMALGGDEPFTGGRTRLLPGLMMGECVPGTELRLACVAFEGPRRDLNAPVDFAALGPAARTVVERVCGGGGYADLSWDGSRVHVIFTYLPAQARPLKNVPPTFRTADGTAGAFLKRPADLVPLTGVAVAGIGPYRGGALTTAAPTDWTVELLKSICVF